MLISRRVTHCAFFVSRVLLTWSGTIIVNHLRGLLIKSLVYWVVPDNFSNLNPSGTFINHLCIEYCCHIWSGAPAIYLEILDKIQRRICNIINFDLASRLPSQFPTNVTWLSFVFSLNIFMVVLMSFLPFILIVYFLTFLISKILF